MARITIEDCLDNVNNRFELVLAATKRARDLSFGRVESSVPVDNDKFTVVALREIAAGNYNYDQYLQEICEKEVSAKDGMHHFNRNVNLEAKHESKQESNTEAE